MTHVIGVFIFWAGMIIAAVGAQVVHDKSPAIPTWLRWSVWLIGSIVVGHGWGMIL